MVYFDNSATTGKKPENVLKAVQTALKNFSANPGRSGHNLSIETAVKIYKIREKIAHFFGSEEPENVAFTLNCTHALNCVIKGCLSSDDHVVVSSLEHNAVMRPLEKINADYDFAEVSLFDDNVTLENFKNKIKKNTKMIICTAASNVIGKKLPIEKIGKLCAERNILFAVDGAQLAGIDEINMKKANIDFLCIAAHKGLYAPMGIGILIARKPIFSTIIEGGTGSNSISFSQPDSMPEMIESGTLNVAGIFGVSAGIDFIKKQGIKRISEYEGELCEKIYRSFLKNPNVRLYAPYSKKDYAPVISFNLKNFSSEETAEALNKRGVAVRAGLHCAPTAHKYIGTLERGTVRISPSVFTTMNEVNYIINIINNL